MFYQNKIITNTNRMNNIKRYNPKKIQCIEK